jgi:hypothetical protein
MDKRDLAVLQAICSFSLENLEEHILHDVFKRSTQGQSLLGAFGEKLDMHIRMLYGASCLRDLQEKAGKIQGYSLGSRGFEECALFLGHTNLEGMLRTGIRWVVMHGVPITGNELSAGLRESGFKPLSTGEIYYVLRIMWNRRWIGFDGFIGGDLTITKIKGEGYIAADPLG